MTLQMKTDVLAMAGNHFSDKKRPYTSRMGVTLSVIDAGTGQCTVTVSKRCRFPFKVLCKRTISTDTC